MTPPVSRKRGVAGGLWCVAGTGVTVATVAGLFRDGYRIGDIVRENPHLTADQVEDALRWFATRPPKLMREILRRRA